MKFIFSSRNLRGRERKIQRFFEILPGATSWSILLGMTALCFLEPLVAGVLIIAFDFYWLLRILYTTLFLVAAYFRLSVEKETDWMKRVQELDRLDFHAAESDAPPRRLSLKQSISRWVHLKELDRLRRSGRKPPLFSEIRHLVILPVVKESIDVLEPGIRSLRHQNFPLKNILVVVALEARAAAGIQEGVTALRKKYDCFMDFLVVVHPDGLPGEARVKGANVTSAARAAAGYFEKRAVPFEKVVVSCFDADTVVSADYFAALTYHFMVSPDRTHCSFQPIPVYHNNIWDVPGFARVLEMGSSFFQLIEATNPEKLVTFSSHSMSFQALVDVGYWPVDMISDDSAIFWKAYIHFDGHYRVVPLYVTLSMDVAAAGTWWKTARNVYKQKRRWAWGVENFPIVMRAFMRNKRIALWNRARHAFKLFEGHVAWATWAFMLTFIGWLPMLFAGRHFSDSVLYYSVPRITRVIFNLAFLSLLTTIILSLSLLPEKKVKNTFFRRVAFALEWLFVPVIATCWSALPALDTQTRFMFGKYMEFWVTEKKRKI